MLISILDFSIDSLFLATTFAQRIKPNTQLGIIRRHPIILNLKKQRYLTQKQALPNSFHRLDLY